MRPKKISVCVPTYNGDLCYRTATTIFHAAMTPNVEIGIEFQSTSALTFLFNKLLMTAFYSDCDYWVLLHADLGAKEKNWLATMIDEMTTEDLAVISAVAAIKSKDGLTSTAVDTSEHFPRRLTLTEIHQGPETLTNEKCKRIHGDRLLINTGLMIWDMNKMRQHVKDLPFQFEDGWYEIQTELGPRMVPYFHPEDWLMSQRLDELGIKYGATRKVHTIHKGSMEFDSSEIWGAPADEQYLRNRKQ